MSNVPKAERLLARMGRFINIGAPILGALLVAGVAGFEPGRALLGGLCAGSAGCGAEGVMDSTDQRPRLASFCFWIDERRNTMMKYTLAMPHGNRLATARLDCARDRGDRVAGTALWTLRNV
jgi:hypothetical protein